GVAWEVGVGWGGGRGLGCWGGGVGHARPRRGGRMVMPAGPRPCDRADPWGGAASDEERLARTRRVARKTSRIDPALIVQSAGHAPDIVISKQYQWLD